MYFFIKMCKYEMLIKIYIFLKKQSIALIQEFTEFEFLLNLHCQIFFYATGLS